ncbi:MAG: DUF6631 family protein [Luteimonas sp.]
MARKVDKQKPAAEEPSAAEKLASLKPDTPLALSGRQVTVREYSFFEGLEIAHRAAKFIADMHVMCAGGDLRYAQIRRLFGVHQEVVIPIAAQAADVEPEWVRSLKGDEAEVFMSTWFAVNSSFFVHEVIVEMREERQRAIPTSTGTDASPNSPPPASATSTNSPASPNDN